jgi:hypothetical protein
MLTRRKKKCSEKANEIKRSDRVRPRDTREGAKMEILSSRVRDIISADTADTTDDRNGKSAIDPKFYAVSDARKKADTSR